MANCFCSTLNSSSWLPVLVCFVIQEVVVLNRKLLSHYNLQNTLGGTQINIIIQQESKNKIKDSQNFSAPLAHNIFPHSVYSLERWCIPCVPKTLISSWADKDSKAASTNTWTGGISLAQAVVLTGLILPTLKLRLHFSSHMNNCTELE